MHPLLPSVQLSYKPQDASNPLSNISLCKCANNAPFV